MKEYNYLKLVKKLGECKQGDERQCLQAVYSQLKDLTEDQIKKIVQAGVSCVFIMRYT
ncbi:hypothetical protein [Enterococcus hirae]